MMIGLMNMTQKIMSKVYQTLSEKIVKEKDLINEIFKEFLFKSVFSSNKEEKGVETMLEIIQKLGPRKVKYTSNSSFAENKSRTAAFNLLHDLTKKSPLTMSNFIKNQLLPLFEMIKKPKQLNYQPSSTAGRT